MEIFDEKAYYSRQLPDAAVTNRPGYCPRDVTELTKGRSPSAASALLFGAAARTPGAGIVPHAFY